MEKIKFDISKFSIRRRMSDFDFSSIKVGEALKSQELSELRSLRQLFYSARRVNKNYEGMSFRLHTDKEAGLYYLVRIS